MRQSHFGVTLIQIARRRSAIADYGQKKPSFVEVGAEAEVYEFSVLVTLPVVFELDCSSYSVRYIKACE